MTIKRLLIVGGVAGGASCAARARRLNEAARIIVFERGSFVSFANCGLPYHVGRIITDEQDLLVATPELFRDRFNVEVRVRHNVTAVDPKARTITVEDLDSGRVCQEAYDALVLAPGAEPLRPPIAGIDGEGIFNLWTIPDMRRIIHWMQTRKVTRAAVLGAGFIGLEAAENLARLGIAVTIVEMQDQVMPAMDPEMAAAVQIHLAAAGVDLRLGEKVAGFARRDDCLVVETAGGRKFSTDMVILAAGGRPRTELASAAGLAIGSRGAILVDRQMRTSDPFIWAVGDAVQVHSAVTGADTALPLAGPANRQGRLVADVLFGQTAPLFRGVQGTFVCGVLGLTVAATGLSEKTLTQIPPYDRRERWEKVYLHPDHHAGYYPGAKPIFIKLLFDRADGRILGAQAVGEQGVEKRIDVIATAMQFKATVADLAQTELCYAPPYGSAKDPVNLAGMIAANVIDGLVDQAHWEDLAASGAFVLDVREPEEFAQGRVPGAINIPLHSLRGRLDELPRDREIWAHCFVGQRSYVAARILMQHGFAVKNISGGFRLYRVMQAAGLI